MGDGEAEIKMRDVKEVELKTIRYLLFGGGIENLFIYSCGHLFITFIGYLQKYLLTYFLALEK